MYSQFGNGPLREFPQGVTMFVTKGNVALAADATALISTTGNGSAIVADGQMAIVNADTNTTITTGNTVANVQRIKLVIGTENSADFSTAGPVDRFPFLESAVINGASLMAFSGKAFSVGQLGAYIIGKPSGTNGQIPVASNTLYSLNLAWQSPRGDKYFSTSGREFLPVGFTTPDYTATGLNLSAANSLAHLVENVGYKVNLQSSAFSSAFTQRGRGLHKVVALAIDYGGGAGTGTGTSTAVSTSFIDIIAGTSATIPVAVINGTTVSIANTPEVKAAFTALVADTAITNAATVEVIDLSQAGAGRTPDTLMLLGLDETKSLATDEIPFVRSNLIVGLDGGYKTGVVPTIVESVDAKEGSGQGWKLEIDEKYRSQRTQWSNQMVGIENFLEAKARVDKTASYNVYALQVANDFAVGYSHTANHNNLYVIAVPTGDTTTIASLNAKLAPWLNSVSNIQVNTFASAPSLF